MNTLLTGGIAAAAVAAWTQVKSTFSYLSSFIVIQAHLDESASWAMNKVIKREWTLLPSGQIRYKTARIFFSGDTHTTYVPFKLSGPTAIYRQGWRFLFIRDDGDRMKISYLRGTVNLDALIADALRSLNETNKSEYDSRFIVYEYVGVDRSTMFSNEVPSRGPRTGSTLSADEVSEGKVRLNTDIDKSFMYDSSCWSMMDTTIDPFKFLYYNESIEVYIKQAERWLSRKEWYKARHIPWRRGWMLHGPGGTGKTSLSKAVAQRLNIPVYQYYLNTMSDQEFIKFWEGMELPCMVLFEDFDNVFHGRVAQGKTMLTFDTVLNKLSGINSTEGLFVIITTNDPSKVDPAIGVAANADGLSTRPGRIDTVIEVGNLDLRGRQKMAERILKDWPEEIGPLVAFNTEVTPVQFQELCLQLALKKISEEENAYNHGASEVAHVQSSASSNSIRRGDDYWLSA